MSLISSFRSLFGASDKSSADTAKERLMVVISHQRGSAASAPDFLPQLQKELMALLSKYMPTAEVDANVQFTREGDSDLLKVDISMPTR